MSYNLQKRIYNNTLTQLQPVQLRLNFVQPNFLTPSSTLDIRVKQSPKCCQFEYYYKSVLEMGKNPLLLVPPSQKMFYLFLICNSHHLECFNDKISTLVDSKTNSDKVHTDQWSSQYCTNDQLIKKPLPQNLLGPSSA